MISSRTKRNLPRREVNQVLLLLEEKEEPSREVKVERVEAEETKAEEEAKEDVAASLVKEVVFPVFKREFQRRDVQES